MSETGIGDDTNHTYGTRTVETQGDRTARQMAMSEIASIDRNFTTHQRLQLLRRNEGLGGLDRTSTQKRLPFLGHSRLHSTSARHVAPSAPAMVSYWWL